MKTLKTLSVIVLAVLTLTAVSNQAFAQTAETDSENITLTAYLNTTLALTLDASTVTFTFDELSEYQNGIGAADEVTLTGDVASTGNWKLAYKATTTLEHQDQAGTTIPLNQVGVRAGLTGNYAALGYTSNNASANPLALESSDVVILTKATGESNAGASADNGFTIYWEMGTGNGNMNATSLFTADYRRGEYEATIQFTLTEVFP
ncbi:MAG: hypothetical protein U9R19_16080 [Bacteroidota bacterium]|nr:hypothetical protein [Bacteroidota bacterium]